MEQGKTCTKCGEWKSLNEFHRTTKTKDGRVSKCKECFKQYNKQFYKENANSINQRTKQYKLENADYIKKYYKQYQQINADTIKKRKQKQYENNINYFKQYGRERYQKNTDYFIQYGKKYRQSEKGREADYRKNVKRRSHKNNVEFTPYQRKVILERDKYTCKCCGIKVHDRKTGNWNTPDKAEIDHIVPISKGGNSEPNNLQILCRTCNRSKADNKQYINQS